MSKPSTRTEKDSLGYKDVPADAYYGIQTARAVENFPISGLRAHATLIRAIAMVKEAAAEANRELGLLDVKTANAIITAAKEIQAGKWHEHFVVDVFQAGAGVSFHMNANEVIANRASELLGGKLGEYKHAHPNDHVNYGQSTNDVFPTAMRLAALLELEKLYAALDGLIAAFNDKGKEFHHILKSGRTHMMDAVPMRLGQEFSAYAAAIVRAKKALEQQSELLRELGLGGSAVGTGINTHPDYREKAVANLARISSQQPARRRHALRDAVEPGDGVGQLGASKSRARGHPHLQRSSAALVRPQHWPRRNQPAGAAARLVHHAWQNQPGDGRTGRDGFVSGSRLRHRGRARRAGRTTRTQRHDADHGAQRAHFDHHHDQHAAPVDGVLHQRDHRQREALRVLRPEYGVAGDGSQSLHRLRQGSGDRQGIGRNRQDHHRNRALQGISQRRTDQDDSRPGAHDRTAAPAASGEEKEEKQTWWLIPS